MQLPMVLRKHLSWPNCCKTVLCGETGFGAVEGHGQQPLAAGWHGGIGMPHTYWGLGTGEVGETAKIGESPEGDEEVVIVFTLPVIHISHCRLPLPLPLRLHKHDLHLSLEVIHTAKKCVHHAKPSVNRAQLVAMCTQCSPIIDHSVQILRHVFDDGQYKISLEFTKPKCEVGKLRLCP